MIEEIARVIVRATEGIDLLDWIKIYLIVFITGSISAAIAYKVTYCTDKHSKSRNNENEGDILQDKDNEKNRVCHSDTLREEE